MPVDGELPTVGTLHATSVQQEVNIKMLLYDVLYRFYEAALQKLSLTNAKRDNYIFITTEKINREVQEYARSLYSNTGGIEFAIFDCISFIRHFFHLFHRL